MLSLEYIKQNTEACRIGFQKKHADPNLVDQYLDKDQQRRALITEVETLRSQKNALSSSIPTLQGAEKEAALTQAKEIGSQLSVKEAELTTFLEAFRLFELTLPNPAHESVPFGADDSENVVLRRVGEQRAFDFAPQAHFDLGVTRGWLDFERGAKVAGARFTFLKGDILRLQFALVQWALDTIAAKGFEMIYPPVMVNRDTVLGTGYLQAQSKDDEAYCVNPDKDDLYMIATSEAPIISYHKNEILDNEKFYVGYSTCFRREAGSGGKDTKGLIRQHQFDKVEMIAFVQPETSYEHMDRILGIEESLLQSLGIPYEVMLICGGDLGAPGAKKYDINAWMPGLGAYREVTSNSNLTEYHARRLNMRIRDIDGAPRYCHTISATGLPIGRTLIAIIENYQNADGTVTVPEVLRPYMGGTTAI